MFSSQAALPTGGCFFVEQTHGVVSLPAESSTYLRTTGDQALDRAVNEMLFRAARTFSLDRTQYPTFRFLPPGARGGDGYANGSIVLEPGTKGLVALSVTLLAASGFDDENRLLFEVILGHEFAHIYQVRNAYIEQLLVAANGGGKFVELHADYLAGWFISKKSDSGFGFGPGIALPTLRRAAETLFARGDNNVGQPGHHGTRSERFAATLQGYLDGDRSDYANGAAENGISYLRGLIK
jgi:hypothetical protein